MYFLIPRTRRQLDALGAYEEDTVESSTANDPVLELEVLDSRLGRAGYLTRTQQRRFVQYLVLCWCLLLAVGLCVGWLAAWNSWWIIGLLVVGSYCYVLAALVFVKVKAKNFERELLFYLPLTLEQLLLLTHAGLGVVSAVRELVDAETYNPIVPFLTAVYQRAERGETFESALADVAEHCPFHTLKHFFLHLETSMALGAELAHSLTQLSEHIHREWQVSLEGMVRRLESAVVFPVFFAVIGLLVLVAAVPIVPLLELSDNMKQSQEASMLQSPVMQQSSAVR